MIEIVYPDKDRFQDNKDYRDGVLAGINLEATATERQRAERSLINAAIMKRRCIGWDGPNGGVYYWFVGWDCWSLGAHICFGAPNIEIHLPFGFIRIGWHTNREARREIAAMAKQCPSEAQNA